jgi:hypothetical protein
MTSGQNASTSSQQSDNYSYHRNRDVDIFSNPHISYERKDAEGYTH